MLPPLNARALGGRIAAVRIDRRKLTGAESRAPLSGFSIFSRTRRRQDRLERDRGEVETFEFRVVRAWNLITCAGPPCCPNTWLVEADSGEFVHLESWTLLRAEGERFPGSHVTVARLPLTHRLVSALVAEELVSAPRLEDEDEHLVDDLPECEIVPLAQIPPACRR
jgi:hypothetical protein